MKNVLVTAVAVMVFVSGASFSEGKEKKKKVTSAPSSTVKAAPAAPAIPATPPGWTDVKTNAPTFAKVSYKIDGRDILVNFKNLRKDAPVRIKYTVKWQKNVNGKWSSDSTMEGISFRLKPLEELGREIRTRAPEVKDVVVDVDVSETS